MQYYALRDVLLPIFSWTNKDMKRDNQRGLQFPSKQIYYKISVNVT